MNNNMISDSLYSAFSGLFLLSGNFFSGVIVANHLGLNDTGTFYFFVAICLLISAVLDGGAASSVVRFQATLHGKDDRRAAHALAGRLARHLVAYTVLGLSVLLLTHSHLPSAMDLPTPADIPPGKTDVSFPLLLAVSISIQTMAMFGVAYLRGSRRFRTLAVLSLVAMATQLGFVFLSAVAMGVNGAIVAYGMGQMPLAIVTLSLLFRRGRLNRAVAADLRRYQRFVWAANVCNIFVWSRIEIFLLHYFWGPREVGLFSIALALSALASQGPMLMTGAFLPFLSERQGKGDTEGLQRAFSGGTRLLAMVAFPACMGMVSIVPAMIALIYGPHFTAAAPASMIVCAAAAISITAVIGTHMVNALARSDFIFYTSLVGAFLSFALGLSIIPTFAVVGAAMARSITQLVMVGAGIWFVTARLGFAYPFVALLRIFLATLPAACTAYFVVALTGGIVGLIVAIALFIPVYIVGLRLFSALSASDAELLDGLSRRLPRLPAQLLHRFLIAVRPATMAERNLNPAE